MSPRSLPLLLAALLLAAAACSDPAQDDDDVGPWAMDAGDNNDPGNNGSNNDGASNNDQPDNNAQNNSSNNASTGNNASNNAPTDAGMDDAGGDVGEEAGEDAGEDVAPDAPAEGVVVRSGAVVEYSGAGSTVAVSGSFNGWDTQGTPMSEQGGVWRAELDVEPGNYPYKFIIDGQFESSVPPDVYTQWDGQVENRSLRVPDCHAPEWRALETDVADDGTITGRFQFARAVEDSPLDADSVSLTVGGATVAPEVDAETEVVSFSYAAPDHGKYSLRLSGADARGVAAENNPFYLPLWHEEEPFTWQDGVMYLIFTDRFNDTDGRDTGIEGASPRADYMGGDFRGITQKIEEGYFEAMGVNALWLSPVYDNTDQTYPDKNNQRFDEAMTGFHGYWPISLDPEPRYGDDDASAEERLLELTRVAHEHGIRILFDLALNHVHEDHPYCDNEGWCDQTCICGGDNCGWDPFNGRGLDCQFDTFLPDLSYRNHAIVERVIADTLAMIEKYDVDGLRIDAARHMDHVIMRTLRMTLRDRIEANGGAPYYMVGETFTDNHGEIMTFVADHELHGQFDFYTRSRIRETFVYGGSFMDLDNAMAFNESAQGYGEFVWWMSPFFGNHDIDRTATVIAGNDQGPWGDTPDLMATGPADDVDQWDIINKMSMAYAFLLTYKGIPLIYYGDEVGLAGSRDPDNRRMMFWDLNANQEELLGRVRAIGRARRELRPLRHGERQQLWRDQDRYVYIRSIEPGDGVIVAMNKGSQSQTWSVTVPGRFGLEGVTLQSWTSGRTITVADETAVVTLDPWEYAIFHP